MNCSEAERRIYLHRELTDREREEVQRHLETCVSCSRIMERAGEMQRMIKSQYANPLPIVGESVMTRRIMNAVEELQKKKTSSVFECLFADLSNNPLRYTMVAVSLFLVVAFVTEYGMESQSPLLVKRYPPVPGRKTELNSASFHDAFIAAKENNKGKEISFYECLVTCLNSPNTDCADCKNKFAKR